MFEVFLRDPSIFHREAYYLFIWFLKKKKNKFFLFFFNWETNFYFFIKIITLDYAHFFNVATKEFSHGSKDWVYKVMTFYFLFYKNNQNRSNKSFFLILELKKNLVFRTKKTWSGPNPCICDAQALRAARAGLKD